MKDSKLTWIKSDDIDVVIEDLSNGHKTIIYKNGSEIRVDDSIAFYNEDDVIKEEVLHNFDVDFQINVSWDRKDGTPSNSEGKPLNSNEHAVQSDIRQTIAETDYLPPRKAELLLLFILKKGDSENLIGDLEESYVTDKLPRYGRRIADKWYWTQVCKSVLPLLFNRLVAIIASVWKYFGA